MTSALAVVAGMGVPVVALTGTLPPPMVPELCHALGLDDGRLVNTTRQECTRTDVVVRVQVLANMDLSTGTTTKSVRAPLSLAFLMTSAPISKRPQTVGAPILGGPAPISHARPSRPCGPLRARTAPRHTDPGPPHQGLAPGVPHLALRVRNKNRATTTRARHPPAFRAHGPALKKEKTRTRNEPSTR